MSGKKEGGAEEEDMYICFGGFSFSVFAFFVLLWCFLLRVG